MSKLKVLIVENDALTSMALETMLLKEGYEVVGEASSGLKAIQIFREKKPHLVLLDIKLNGEMSGTDVGSIIASERAVPIIYLTAHPELYNEAKNTQPFAFLEKPYNQAGLSRSIELALLKFSLPSESETIDKQQFPNLFFAGNCIWIKQGAGKPFVRVPLDTIRHVRADNVYLEIETSDNQYSKHCIVFKISDFEAHIQYSKLIRVHISHLINIDWVKSFSRQTGIFLKGCKEGIVNKDTNAESKSRPDGCSTPIPISKTYFDNFIQAIQG